VEYRGGTCGAAHWGHLGAVARRRRSAVLAPGRRRTVDVGEHMKEAAMARVGLRDIVSLGDRAAVMGLRRGPGQDQYLDSMEEIFGEADWGSPRSPLPA
jgi:hypothetical protein